ncbi:enoyl-CoA hydratase/isomerase family protein [Desulfopila sp. IMCC35008]|uniref:enoyl-CoA hydratase/isomerase family protein n=1 Tax=Desulfopila sp. IMCC35008 TaxID=2653858 RepID=UPI0013D2BC18|nr:enoyl-CoA hydratase/isomerase family protein [Desulfopila sp. IMCC35008]
MEIVRWEKQKNIAVVTMCNGANRQNLEFAGQMNQCLDQILMEESLQSIVLTSSDEKNFSQGIDVEWLTERFAKQDFNTIKTFMYEMNTVFKRLLLMPLPVVAAINGHAFGNGAIISCACDFRFMTKDKGFFCFPEVDVNIPFLPGMIAFVEKAVPEPLFNEMLLSGKRVTAPELEHHNVIVSASENRAELLAQAMEYAGTFTKPRPIFGELKKRKHKEIIRVIEEEDPEFIEPLNLMMK